MLTGAAPEPTGPTVSTEIGVRAEVLPGGANPILVESDNDLIANDLGVLLERAAGGEIVIEELAESGAVIRVEAHPPVDEANLVEIVVEYVGN